MTYNIFVLISQQAGTDDKISLTFDSESEARTRYNRLAPLGSVELIQIIRNPNARFEGTVYLLRNFGTPASY